MHTANLKDELIADEMRRTKLAAAISEVCCSSNSLPLFPFTGFLFLIRNQKNPTKTHRLSTSASPTKMQSNSRRVSSPLFLFLLKSQSQEEGHQFSFEYANDVFATDSSGCHRICRDEAVVVQLVGWRRFRARIKKEEKEGEGTRREGREGKGRGKENYHYYISFPPCSVSRNIE